MGDALSVIPSEITLLLQPIYGVLFGGDVV